MATLRTDPSCEIGATTRICRGDYAGMASARLRKMSRMAKTDFSFDIVSQVSMPEVTNAVDQARRELSQRFDFKDTGTAISQDEKVIEVRSSTEDRLKAAVEVLKEKAVRREISLKALHFGPVQPAAKGTQKQSIDVNVGISDDKARELVKFVKGLKVKVQAQVQGDQVRITGKAKDDLQAVIRAIKEKDFGLALQFVNFRP
jgi:cyclic-di-GMP-binding protein